MALWLESYIRLLKDTKISIDFLSTLEDTCHVKKLEFYTEFIFNLLTFDLGCYQISALQKSIEMLKMICISLGSEENTKEKTNLD